MITHPPPTALVFIFISFVLGKRAETFPYTFLFTVSEFGGYSFE